MSEDIRPENNTLSGVPTRGSDSTSTGLLRTSVGTSQEYLENAATVVSHAMLPNPLWRLWFDPPDAEEDRLQTYHSLVKQFLGPAMVLGAFITEAEDFATCASWWPPGSHDPPTTHEGEGFYADFARETNKIYAEYVWSKYGQEFWHLVILARDPRKTPPVPGAVRAVLQPVIDRAAMEGKPIWLLTSNQHARDIYLHLEWQLVGTVTLHGHSQWCMIRYPLTST